MIAGQPVSLRSPMVCVYVCVGSVDDSFRGEMSKAKFSSVASDTNTSIHS